MALLSLMSKGMVGISVPGTCLFACRLTPRRVWILLLLTCAALFVGGCRRSETAPENPGVEPPANLTEVRTRAEQGDPLAQRTLGDLHAGGRGVPQDYEQAVSWYRKAAEQGDPAAQNSIGELAEAGQGVAQSNTEAARWYGKAATNGHAAAQYNLAVLHAFGRGVPADPREAAKWYRQAAEQGHALAQFNLGQRYQLGKGVPVDRVEAYKWLSLAAKSVPDSKQMAEEVRSQLTREDLDEARRRIAEFGRASRATSIGR